MSAGNGTMTVQEAIDRIGFGRFQKRLLAVCGVTWVADSAEILMLGFALPSIIAEFAISPAQAGLIATATFAGMLVGAWFWGTVSDYIGRRTGFQLTVLTFAVFGLLSAFAPSWEWLAVLRFITGFGLGGALPLDFSVYAEFLPSENRGRNLVILESFWAVGTILAAGLAWLLVPSFGWRPLLAASALAALLVLWIRKSIPESPRFLAISGRADEAKEILTGIAAENGRPAPEQTLVAGERQGGVTVTRLWVPGIRRSTLMLWIAWFCVALAYYGIFTWLPSTFAEQGFSPLRTYQSTFILALAQLPGYFSAAYLIERIGRRNTLGLYLLASGVFTFLFATASGFGWILTASILMSFFSLGAWGALYAWTPELYPTEIRATGMGWASGMSRIAGVFAPILGGILFGLATTAGGSLLYVLSLWSASFIVGGIVVFLLGVETKRRALSDTVSDSSEEVAKEV
ncbi:major facilitator superfamily MFS_1 [Rubrobacter xylanophilus DSM 9941]|uniref:Major facilitator superfamily MFS_1 n=1 Tax=Rubrobacter xylanophilus (strain DSM 9941 / JCM 11954 / NBRC 16129 / PRD-1) TaxID=266117 RepID=Q1AUV3_RUBXD|nr:MFS transporter [Rubrobacter xylanophilus]ABG04825.1 major facilitator superfamily MFS_1 [Rubrobacter xylanophilus DSM 9941]